MEILVVVAIILVLAALSLPVVATVRNRADKVTATQKMTQLGTAAGAYISENDGQLPAEDAKGTDG